MASARLRMAAFYVLGTAALVTLMTRSQQAVLPDSLASQVGNNSEALLFALLVCAGVQIRRELVGSARLVMLCSSALALVGIGVLLLRTDWTSSVRTLNEALIGAGMVLAYMALPRSRRLGVGCALAVLAVIIIFFDTGVVLDQAESLVPLMLAGPALDVFDRTILQPGLEDEPGLRWVWIAMLAAAGLAFMVAAAWARLDLAGSLRLGIDYGQRAAEAYWGWIIVHGYFGVWLGSTWRQSTGRHQRELTAT